MKEETVDENDARMDESKIQALKKVMRFVESDELEGHLERMKALLSEEDYELLEQVYQWHADFFAALREDDITDEELRERFLPGPG